MMGSLSLTPHSPDQHHWGVSNRTTSKQTVVFVVFPGCQSLDLAGPFEVFNGANLLAGNQPYRLLVASIDGNDVTTESGLRLGVDVVLGNIRGPIDTLIVVGGFGVFSAAAHNRTLKHVARLAKSARRISSVCTGAYILGAAGLIDGRTVCTHWASITDFQQRFPNVTVDTQSIFNTDGNVWTSAGVTAGIDLALALVEADLGSTTAQTIARWMVMFLRRPGGQSQFAGSLWREPSKNEHIKAVQQRVVAAPHEDHTIVTMAARAAMSERNFIRVFTTTVGMTPAKFVEAVRVDAASQLLETTADNVELVAAKCGFGTAETLRKSMLRAKGISPTDYRQRFSLAKQ
jgi:transcriptional regulator GlxA family with amidase domain